MSTESRAGVRPPSGAPDASPSDASAAVTVRFWAGARAAAGAETTTVHAATLGDLRVALVDWRPALAPVLEVSSVLIDGRTTSDLATALDATMSVEVLPPFAGG